jgi:hypothetical protein
MFDLKAFERDHLAEEVEKELQRRLILQIIEAGVRSMALKMHPDVGGSDEAMHRLTTCKERLRKDYAKMPRLKRSMRLSVSQALRPIG